jgi:hypothetical protein
MSVVNYQYTQSVYSGSSPVLATANSLYQSAQLTEMNRVTALPSYGANSYVLGPASLLFDGTNYIYTGSSSYILFG